MQTYKGIYHGGADYPLYCYIIAINAWLVLLWDACYYIIPEFVSDKDDPPLEQKGGENLQEFCDTETFQQTVKVHMLQSGVHRSA